jgi:hypothetical protein
MSLADRLESNGLIVRTPDAFYNPQSIRFVTSDEDEEDLLADRLAYSGGAIIFDRQIGCDADEQPTQSSHQCTLKSTGDSTWWISIQTVNGTHWLAFQLDNQPSISTQALTFAGSDTSVIKLQGSISTDSLRVGNFSPTGRPSDNDVIVDGGLVVGAVAGSEDPAPGTIALTDGVTAPGASIAGMAILYIDTADGDLKVRFADGHVTTIAADS